MRKLNLWAGSWLAIVTFGLVGCAAPESDSNYIDEGYDSGVEGVVPAGEADRWRADPPFPVGELLPELAGYGDSSETNHSPGMRFPIQDAPAYSRVVLYAYNGGTNAPQAYPWRDTYCEKAHNGDSGASTCGKQGTGVHHGIDILPSTRSNDVHPMLSATAGTVSSIGSFSVNVNGDDGKKYQYLHGLSVAVGEGQRVSAGTKIANVGNNMGGAATVVHLHFGIRVPTSSGFMWVNPYPASVDAYERLIGANTVATKSDIYFEGSTGVVSGWGCDPARPTSSTNVVITAGFFPAFTIPVARVQANRPSSAAVNAACGGGTGHGFVLRVGPEFQSLYIASRAESFNGR
ncbi:MAG: M23 family metallopeptidase [Polyangiales bacterium]